MKIKASLSGICALTYFISTLALADTQTITPSKINFKAKTGDIVEFDVNYASSSPHETTGLGLKLNFDSNYLSLLDVSDVFAKGKIAQATDVKNQSTLKRSANKNATEKVIKIAWLSPAGDWPGVRGKATKLLKARFKVTHDLSSQTSIHFSGDTSAGNTFSATPVTIVAAETQQTASSNNQDSSGGGSLSWLLMSFLILFGTVTKRATKKK